MMALGRRELSWAVLMVTGLAIGAGSATGQGIQMGLRRPACEPKLSRRLAELVQTAKPGERLKVWVFFTDKGLMDEKALAQVLSRPRSVLTERALRRRRKVRPEGPLIAFPDLPLHEPYVRTILATGARLRTRSRWFNAVSVWATPDQVLSIARLPFVSRLQPVAGARRPEPERLHDGAVTQSSEMESVRYRLDYGASLEQLEQIQVPLLHELGYTGRGVLVAMFDTGFYKDHEAFRHLRIVAERDFVMGDNDTQRDPSNPEDYSDSHGTMTWSTLAGFREGWLVGPAYGADFLLAKTEDTRSETPVEEDYWAAAAEWADSLGADVISSSLGYYDWYKFEDMDGNTAISTIAADWAAQQGLAVVVAAGNWNETAWGHISAPADGDSVITVGAVDRRGVIASFSSRGPTYDGRIKPEVCARGVGTRCAVRSGPAGYGYASGTSLSTPLIAGVCALLLEAHPEWAGWDVRQALLTTASQAHRPDNTYGWGIARAFAASGLKAPVLVITNFELLEPDTTRNGAIDPGEEIGFRLEIRNEGNLPTGGGQIIFRSEAQQLHFADSVASFGRLNPGSETSVESARALRVVDDLSGIAGVDLAIAMETTEGRRFERSLRLTVAGLYAVRGIVWDLGAGTPVAGASVGFRPKAASVDSLSFSLTGSDGRFEAYLSAGWYVAQAMKDGFFPSLAADFSLPAWETGEIHLALTRPKLQWSRIGPFPSSERQNWQEGRITVRNNGSGSLFFSALPHVERPFPQGEAYSIHLWKELAELSLLDVADLWADVSADSVRLTVGHCENLSETLPLRWIVSLDLDESMVTGASIDGIGADARLVIEGLTVRLEEWSGREWLSGNNVGTARISERQLVASVATSCLADARFSAVPARVVAQARVGGRWATYDHVPDPGPWRVYFPTGPVQGLHLEEATGSLDPGRESAVVFAFDANLLGEDAPELVLTSWDPRQPVLLIDLQAPAGVARSKIAPADWRLVEPHPNPFAHLTTFGVRGMAGEKIVARIFDVRGRLVREMESGTSRGGWVQLRWDGRDGGGTPLANGVYLLRLEDTRGFKAARKLVLMR